MRATVSVDPATLANMQALQTMLRKREIAEQASSRAAFLIRKQDDKRWGEDGKPRNRAERRRAASLGRC